MCVSVRAARNLPFLSLQPEPESLDIEDHLYGYLINVSTLLFLVLHLYAIPYIIAYLTCVCLFVDPFLLLEWFKFFVVSFSALG